MIWQWRDDQWRKRFALLPLFVNRGNDRAVVWLQWFWKRNSGDYTAISLTEPCDSDASLAGKGLSPEGVAEQVREAAAELERAEAEYRHDHDVYGAADSRTGRSWDLMRRAGDKVRDALRLSSDLGVV